MAYSRRSLGQRSRAGRAAGFTLIEVLLVLIILVIVGSLAVNVFTGTQDRASLNAAKSNLSLVRGAIDRYRLDMNKLPAEWKQKFADIPRAEATLSPIELDGKKAPAPHAKYVIALDQDFKKNVLQKR